MDNNNISNQLNNLRQIINLVSNIAPQSRSLSHNLAPTNHRRQNVQETPNRWSLIETNYYITPYEVQDHLRSLRQNVQFSNYQLYNDDMQSDLISYFTDIINNNLNVSPVNEPSQFLTSIVNHLINSTSETYQDSSTFLNINNQYDNYINNILDALFQNQEIVTEKMTIEEFDRLKHSEYKIHGSDDNHQCTICMEHFDENEKITTLPCKHFYHTDCIKPWLLNNNVVCPLCKQDTRQHSDNHS